MRLTKSRMSTRKCLKRNIRNGFCREQLRIGLKMVFVINLFNLTIHFTNYEFFLDGTGYVEDGREIFDDEEVEEHEDTKKRDKSNKKEAKKRLRDVNKPVEGNASIRSMFGNVAAKKKEPKVKLDDDDILAGILGEINPHDSKTNGTTSSAAEASTKSKSSSVSANKIKEKTEMAMVKDYIASFSKVVPRKQEVKTETEDDVSSIYKFH